MHQLACGSLTPPPPPIPSPPPFPPPPFICLLMHELFYHWALMDSSVSRCFMMWGGRLHKDWRISAQGAPPHTQTHRHTSPSFASILLYLAQLFFTPPTDKHMHTHCTRQVTYTHCWIAMGSCGMCVGWSTCPRVKRHRRSLVLNAIKGNRISLSPAAFNLCLQCTYMVPFNSLTLFLLIIFCGVGWREQVQMNKSFVLDFATLDCCRWITGCSCLYSWQEGVVSLYCILGCYFQVWGVSLTRSRMQLRDRVWVSSSAAVVFLTY